MPRRRGLTDKQIESLPRKAKRTIIADPELRGLYLRIPPAGANAPITFTAIARDPYGKQIWTAPGTTADLKIDQARDLARLALRRIKEGKPAIEPPKPKPDSVAMVAENWLRRHVEKNKLRQERDDDYVPPFVRGMRRVPKDQHHRARILTDAATEAREKGNAGRLKLAVAILDRVEKFSDVRPL
jgi:hypothetical protein